MTDEASYETTTGEAGRSTEVRAGSGATEESMPPG